MRRRASESAFLRRSRNHLTWSGDVRGALAVLDEATAGGLRIMMARGALKTSLGNHVGAKADYQRVATEGANNGSRSGPRGIRVAAATWRLRLAATAGAGADMAALRANALEGADALAKDFPDLALGPSLVAEARAARGEKPQALAAMATAMQLVMGTRDASQIARMRRTKADVLVMLGENDAAIAELQAVHAMGFALGYRLRTEFEWEPLRSDPKFQQLMKEAEARAAAQPRPKK